ncbi:Uncharacterized protein HZ326_22179 [Fusarium oxysporum f. sp. albedinis]|nr:Uncharacterized protein HZ326_22179 [Fusarium oxysporum f. sp. albedinis]
MRFFTNVSNDGGYLPLSASSPGRDLDAAWEKLPHQEVCEWLAVTVELGLIVSSWVTSSPGQHSPMRFEIEVTSYRHIYACLRHPQSHQHVWDMAQSRAKRIRWLGPVTPLEYLHQKLRR